MAYDTYNDLVSSIADYLREDNLTSQIGDFVLLFEAIEGAKLVHPYAQKQEVVSISEFPYTLPSDCAHLRSFGVQGELPYTQVSWEHLYNRDRPYNAYSVTAVGDEQKIYVRTLLEAPSDFEITYRAKLGNLVNGVNWLYRNFSMIYLYGSLVQAEPYLNQDQRIATWNAMYQGSLRALETSAKLIEQGAPVRSAVRVRSRI